MALPDYSYHRVVASWGADASLGFAANEYGESFSHIDLTPTGTVDTDWATVPTTPPGGGSEGEEFLRQAGYNFAAGWSITHRFCVSSRFRAGGGSGHMSFRIWDITNSAALVTYSVSARGCNPPLYRVFASAPSQVADFRFRLEYSLNTSDEGDFTWATWEIVNDRGAGDA